MTQIPRWFVTVRRHPSAVLLAAQLLGVVLYPFMGESPTGRAMVSLFGLLVLVLAVWTTRTTPGAHLGLAAARRAGRAADRRRGARSHGKHGAVHVPLRLGARGRSIGRGFGCFTLPH